MTTEDNETYTEPDLWECPRCGYLIVDVLLQMARYDYGCPTCHTSFSLFVLVGSDDE